MTMAMTEAQQHTNDELLKMLQICVRSREEALAAGNEPMAWWFGQTRQGVFAAWVQWLREQGLYDE